MWRDLNLFLVYLKCKVMLSNKLNTYNKENTVVSTCHKYYVHFQLYL